MTQPTDPTLSAEDAALVDALLQHGNHGNTAASGDISERAARVHGWLQTLSSSPLPEPPGDLMERTLSRLQSERLKIQPATGASSGPSHPGSGNTEPPASRSRGFRFVTDLAAMAVAASLLGIVVSLGVFQARQSSNRVACATNLQHFNTAFGTFAASNRGKLPMLATTDPNWLLPNPAVPGSHTNAQNLQPLLNANLLHNANFICAGRDIAGTSMPQNGSIPDSARGYSYVNMFAVDHPEWDGVHGNIVLADRNPLFDPQGALDPHANSANHAGRGNYVLRADGTVTWETSPNVGPAKDNIWTIGAGPEYPRRFVGTETPASEKDIFLAP